MESFFAPFHKPRILVIFFVPSRSKRNKARLHFYYRLRNTNRNSILFGYSSPSLFFFITKNRYVFFSLPLIPLQLLGHYESIVQSFRIWSFATYTSKLSHWTIYFSDRVPCSREPTEATNKLSRGWKIKRFWGFVPFIKLLCTFFYSDHTNEKFASNCFPKQRPPIERCSIYLLFHTETVCIEVFRERTSIWLNKTNYSTNAVNFWRIFAKFLIFCTFLPSAPIFPPWTKESTKKISKSFTYEVYNSYLAYNRSTARLWEQKFLILKGYHARSYHQL